MSGRYRQVRGWVSTAYRDADAWVSTGKRRVWVSIQISSELDTTTPCSSLKSVNLIDECSRRARLWICLEIAVRDGECLADLICVVGFYPNIVARVGLVMRRLRFLGCTERTSRRREKDVSWRCLAGTEKSGEGYRLRAKPRVLLLCRLRTYFRKSSMDVMRCCRVRLLPSNFSTSSSMDFGCLAT